MVIQLPFVWASLLYIIGIATGYNFPSQTYIMLMLAILAGIAFTRKREHLPDILTACFWFLLGATRICMCTNSQESFTDRMVVGLQERANSVNTELVLRLKNTGLEGEYLGVSSALLLGNKDDLGRDTKQAFANVGASHLLALSGMHLGILYGLLYFLFIHRVRFTKWRWAVLPPVLLCIWGYAFLTGLPISLIRASIMLSIITIASISQSKHSPLHILALSAFIILIIAPEELFSISFQLSFTATFFIIVLYKPVTTKFYEKIPNHMLWAFVLSFIAQIGTMPLSAYYFHTFPLLGSLLSIILIPITTIVIYLGMLTILLPVPFLAQTLSLIIKGEMYIIDKAGQIPYSTIHDLYPEKWQIIMLYAFLLCVTLRIVSNVERDEF